MLPDLAAREAWVVGTVVVLAVLRPVGRLGWAAAGTFVAAGVATLGAFVDPGTTAWEALGVVAWIGLGGLLAATAAAPPLRWEPRTGPGAATALLAGVVLLHVGAAGHDGGRVLGPVAAAWGEGTLGPGAIDAVTAGPLAWVLAWLPGSLPGVSWRGGAAALGVVAAAVVVVGAERLGRRWGYVGTARGTAAAVAWSPPLLLAHGVAPAALVATAALVASWWALVEVWGGRHRAGRLSATSGALLGVAVGVAVWPVVVAPLWVGRLGARTAGWFTVGFGAAVVASVAALLPTDIGLLDVWRAAVDEPLATGLAPGGVAVAVAAASLAALLLRRPLSPTRLSAVTGALLLSTVAWWPPAARSAGPVAAVPFVLLAAVAPDRPGERWPPDASLPTGRLEVPA